MHRGFEVPRFLIQSFLHFGSESSIKKKVGLHALFEIIKVGDELFHFERKEGA